MARTRVGEVAKEVSTRVDTPKIDGRRVQGPNVGSKPPGRKDYELALEAWLDEPTVLSVAKAIGTKHDRARRLIDAGIPELGLPPIRKAAQERARAIVAGERSIMRADERSAARTLEARMRAIREQEAHKAKILGDAQHQREQEIGLVRANRQAAIVLGAVNAKLLKGAMALAADLETELAHSKSDPKMKLGYLRTIANIIQRTAETSQAAVKMERLLLGEPTAILGVQDSTGTKPAEDMTPEEAGQWLEAANRAYERAAQRANTIEAEIVTEE